MDAEQIRGLGSMLDDFLGKFADCFARRDTRAHLPVYVGGQLSNLLRKSVEPIALAAERPVRTLQEFLSQLEWDHDRMRECVAKIVIEDHGDCEAIGVMDETGWVKKGRHTPGVQRQYCGAVGKQENCIITVHLGYVTDDFHCLLDGDLYLPESWDADRLRCQAAGIPDDVVYRSKSDIALALYDRARKNGVRFEWLTFDEWYGGKPAFLRALDQRGQKYVAEVPKTVMAWIAPAPQVTQRPFRKRSRGRSRKTPRLVAGSPEPRTLEQLSCRHPALSALPWQTYRIKDTEKGPLVWHVKHVLVSVKDEQGLPAAPQHLLRCTNPLTGEIKYFLSNAPPDTPTTKLLRVAFSRWHVERCFEDGKGRIGLDHWEGRRWIGLQRHLALSLVSYLFLARVQTQMGKKNPGPDGLPTVCGHQRRPAIPHDESDRWPAVARARSLESDVPPDAQRPGPKVTHEEHSSSVERNRYHALVAPPV
jgi:SRSO17 transposase